MKFYVHFINAHDSTEHSDLSETPWGVHRHAEPSVSPHLYEFICDSEQTANRLVAHLEGLKHTDAEWETLLMRGVKIDADSFK